MKTLRYLAIAVGIVSLTACSNAPIKTSPAESDWRLRNFVDNGLEETIRVYNFCYKGKESQFVAARDFKPGSHTVVTKIVQSFNNVESEPREAFVVLNGRFKGGRTYVFQKDINDNEATLWIADVESGEVVTEQTTVTLGVGEVVDNEQRQRRRCEVSSL